MSVISGATHSELRTGNPRPFQASETSPQSTQLPLRTAPGLTLAPRFSTQRPADLVPGSLCASSPPGARWSLLDTGNPQMLGWWEVQSECLSVGASINHANPLDSLECKAKC